ncbi:PKD domain-containing protein [Reichenbachiella sp.]|uniref:PKD domain-containing protein n=1 Tax=Reichenbachiella sp. TaxID=2184521 RepID=UPI003BAFE314
MIKKPNIFVILFFLVTKTYFTYSQQTWPFNDAGGNVVRGKISGTVGDFRGSAATSRFHAGVDMVSPLDNLGAEDGDTDTFDEDQAVYSMHAGTVYVANPNDYWNDYIRVTLTNGRRVYYKHTLPATYDPVTNTNVVAITTGSTVAVGDYLGLMIESTNQHVHVNDNDETGNGNSLPGITNWINNNVSPFTDSGSPDFVFPFNSGEASVGENDANNTSVENNAVEFRQNGHLHDNAENELTTTSTVENVTHKVVYNKVDIVSRMRDRHILSDGSASTSGNNGINRASFEVLDHTNASRGGEIENINFNQVPDNDRADFVFDSRSNQSRHVYILTANPSATNQVYDRFLNTGLRTGQTEDWDLQNRGNKDARSNSEAYFKDGKYTLRLRARDIANANNTASNTTTRDAFMVVDNFKPYIKTVFLISEPVTEIFYDRDWVWNNGTLDFGPDTSTGTSPEEGQNISVSVISSEPMKSVSISIPTLGIINQPMTALENTVEEDLNWQYTIQAASTLAGTHAIEFTGQDYANNHIQSDPSQIPIRNANGTWNGIVNGGVSNPDENHSFEIFGETCDSPGGRIAGACPLHADFSHLMDSSIPLTVNFTDRSTPSDEITAWSWDFGDFTSSSQQNPSHSYSSPGDYMVELTVSRGAEQENISYTINVSNDLNPIFTTSDTQGSKPLSVTFNSSASTGIITSRTWEVSPASGFRYTSGNQSSTNPTIEFYDADIYQVKLKVSDGVNEVESAPVEISAQSGIDAVANFDFTNPAYENSPVEFSSFKSFMPCPNLFGYSWSFGDGGTSDQINPNHSYSTAGQYTVTLCITDNCGSSDCTSKTLTVLDVGAGLTPAFSPQNIRIRAGQEVVFTDLSFPSSSIKKWNWYLELPGNHTGYPYGYEPLQYFIWNNQTFYEKYTPYTYNTAGTYKVKLEVSSSFESQDPGPIAETTVIVEETPELPSSQNLGLPTDYPIKDMVMYEDYLAVIVGSSNTPGTPTDYIYVYKQTNNSWSKIAQLCNFCGGSGTPQWDWLNRYSKIAMYDETIAVIYDSQFDNRIIMFDKGPGEWSDMNAPTQRLCLDANRCGDYPDGNEIEIADIAMGDDRIALGTIENDHGAKKKFVYAINKKNGEWPFLERWSGSDIQKVQVGSSSGSGFNDIAISGNTIVAEFIGKLHVLEYSSSWTEVATLSTSSSYGYVDIEGTSIVASRRSSTNNVFDDPVAYVWEKPINGGWVNNQSPSAYLTLYFDGNYDEHTYMGAGNVAISKGHVYVDVKYGGGSSGTNYVSYIYEKEYGLWTSMKEASILAQGNPLQKGTMYGDEVTVWVERTDRLWMYDLTSYCQTDKYDNKNFVLSAGNWPKVKAGSISLGGGTGAATIQSGAKINYEGNVVVLKPGFNAKNGSTVHIKLVNCDQFDY